MALWVNLRHGKDTCGTGRQVCHLAGERSIRPVHIRTLSGHGAHQQRVRTHAAQGGNTPQNTPKSGNRRRKDHVRHHNDMSAHMGRAGAELV